MHVTSVLTRHPVRNSSSGADMTLLDAARAMNRDALVEIFDGYSSALYNYVLRLSSDPLMADYVVGDVFAKLLDQLSAGHGPNTNLRSYLYEMAYHVIVDNARYSQHEAALEVVDSLRYDGYSIPASLENRILFETIMLAIRNDLTEDQRHVIILRFLEGFSLRETAAIIGKEVNHVKVIQNRAIAKLRMALDNTVV